MPTDEFPSRVFPVRRPSGVLALFVWMLMSSSLAWADPEGTTETDAAGVVTDDHVLAGPRVVESSEKAREAEGMQAGSIFGYTFEGELVHPETSAEEAALAFLDLSEDQWSKVDEILGAWAARFDGWLLAHAGELNTYQVAFQALRGGARDADTRAAIRGLMEETRDLMEPSLASMVAEVLTPAQRAAFEGMLNDYQDATMAEARRRAEEQGRRFFERGYQRGEALRRLGVELRASYERTIGQAGQDLDRLLAELGLSAASEREVRRLLLDSAQESGFRTTPEQRLMVLREIYTVLTPTEREALLRLIRERAAAAEGTRTDPMMSGAVGGTGEAEGGDGGGAAMEAGSTERRRRWREGRQRGAEKTGEP